VASTSLVKLIVSHILLGGGSFNECINKKGKNLESHRLWRQIVSLTPTDAEKVLKVIINQHFSIEEAIQVILDFISNLFKICFYYLY